MENLIGTSVPLLDQGFLELNDFMPHPASGVSGDMAIVANARVSFLGDSKGEAADKKLLFYMMRERHTTPFERVVFSFRLKAPLLVWWQLVRHRTASFNLQSGRYTPFSEGEFYVPDVWRKQSSSNKQGSDGILDDGQQTVLTAALLLQYTECYQNYERALAWGVAKEMARLFLPGFSVYYTGIMTIDAHNLMHLLGLRMEAHAQEEIRVYADAMYQHFFKPLLPWTAESYEEYRLKSLGVIG